MTAPDDMKPVDPSAPADQAAPATPAAPADQAAPAASGDGPVERAETLLESAAEIAIGAAVAPFTGGETVGIVASLTEALEGGVDRLTHLGHHEAAPKPSETDAGDPDANEPGDPPA